MGRSSRPKIEIPSLDSLFSTQAERDSEEKNWVEEIPVDAIDEFPGHPFAVREDDDMRELVESVADAGVIAPTLLRPKSNGRYEMVSGHRRLFASKCAGLDTVPAVVREIPDEQAIILMVDSNLQRTRILPTEKGLAYRMKLEAVKRQGSRADLTSSQLGTKLQQSRSLSEIGKPAGDSRSTVHRYIRLTYLIAGLAALVDEEKLGLTTGSELSFLKEREQRWLLDAIESEQSFPAVGQAIRLKGLSQEGRLTEAETFRLMRERKPNQVSSFRMPMKSVRRFFKEDATQEYMEKRIVLALELLEQRERGRQTTKD